MGPFFLLYLFTLLFGLLVGSFLNVCIYRIPRGESIVFPGSHCPHCNHAIQPWENIPVLSFLGLQGKCRYCQTPISWRYPGVELLTAAFFVLFVHQYAVSFEAFWYLILTCALIVISFIDLDHQIIPDKLSLPGIVVGFIASFFLPLSWYDSLLGILAGGGIILVVGYVGKWVFKKEAMGGGDVKLMAMIGAFLGWKLVLLTLFFASLVGAIVGIVFKLVTGKDYIPFGPFLSAGALLALFFGEKLFFWYWNFILPPQVSQVSAILR